MDRMALKNSAQASGHRAYATHTHTQFIVLAQRLGFLMDCGKKGLLYTITSNTINIKKHFLEFAFITKAFIVFCIH